MVKSWTHFNMQSDDKCSSLPGHACVLQVFLEDPEHWEPRCAGVGFVHVLVWTPEPQDLLQLPQELHSEQCLVRKNSNVIWQQLGTKNVQKVLMSCCCHVVLLSNVKCLMLILGTCWTTFVRWEPALWTLMSQAGVLMRTMRSKQNHCHFHL